MNENENENKNALHCDIYFLEENNKILTKLNCFSA